MPQDTPATAAGTEPTDYELLRDAIEKHLSKFIHDDDVAEVAIYLDAIERAGDRLNTPDTWAPLNRRTLRDDVDRFRNERMPVPTNAPDALRVLALSLEYYEHATEIETRTKNALAELDAETDTLRDGCIRMIMSERDPANDALNVDVFKRTGGRYSKSQTGAKELAEIAPAMLAHYDGRRALAAMKAEAEKEMGVARRRHATAITYANAFLFAGAEVTADAALLDALIRPDVTAGETDRATLSEA